MHQSIILSWKWRNQIPRSTIDLKHPFEYNKETAFRLIIGNTKTKEGKERVQAWIEFFQKRKEMFDKVSSQKEGMAHWVFESLWNRTRGIKTLFIPDKIPQELFEAICEIDLEYLYIWDDGKLGAGQGIHNFELIGKLKNLKGLYISGCQYLKDLKAISQLEKLERFEIFEPKGLNSFEGLEKLKALKGLSVDGGRRGDVIVADLNPLKALKGLECLDFRNFYAKSGDLTPLSHLKNLKYLGIGRRYKLEEYAKVFAALPHCDHALGPYRGLGDKHKECKGEGSLVEPMNKGSRTLCIICNKNKIDVLKKKFFTLVEKYKDPSDWEWHAKVENTLTPGFFWL